jgi:hypothetical protein
MSSVIEVDFDFIASIAGRRVHGAEVDAMARVVRFLVDGGHQPPQGVGPATSDRWCKLDDAFVTISTAWTGPVIYALKREVA